MGEHTLAKYLIPRHCHLVDPQARRAPGIFFGDQRDKHHQIEAKPE
jgi:hypothetical protein